jgi:hypothetical protein
MPTIQSLRQQPGLLPLNPGEADISPAQFGRTQDALANLGKEVANIGSQYVEKVARAEEADAIFEQSLSDSREVEEKKKALKEQYMVDNGDGILRFDPRGKPAKDEITGDTVYPESYSKKIEQLVRDQFQRGMDNMPSDRARNSYRQSADNVVFKEINESLNFEQIETVRHLLEKNEKLKTEATVQVRNNPSLDTLSVKAADVTKYFTENKDALFDEPKANEEHKKAIRTLIREGYFEGMLEKDPEQGLAVLNSIGEPKEKEGKISAAVFGVGGDVKEMSSFLNAEDVNNMRDRFQAKIKEKNLVEAHNINNQLSDIKAAAFMGENVGGISRVASLIEKQDQLGAFRSPEDKVRAYADGVSSVVIGQARTKLAGMTNEEVANAAKNAEALYQREVASMANREGIVIPKEFAAGDRIEVKAKIAATINDVMKDRQTNPAASVLQGNKTLEKSFRESGGGLGASKELNEAYFSQTLKEQQRLGISRQKVLPVESAKAIASQLQQADGANGSVMIEGLKQQTGKYFPQVMDQLVKDGKLPEYYMTASYTDDPTAANAIINGMKNKQSFETVLKDSGTGFRKKDIVNYVNQEFDPYYKSMIGGGTSGENHRTAQSLRQAVYYETANLVSRGVDPEEAASKAVDTIIRNKNDIYKGVMIPRDVSERAKASMDIVKDKDFIFRNVEKLYLPDEKGMVKEFQTEGEKFAALSEKAKRVRMALQDDNAHAWISKEDSSGAILNYRIRNERNPLGFDIIPVKTNDGGFVEINWDNPEVKVGK